jgi:hypothetical protein
MTRGRIHGTDKLFLVTGYFAGRYIDPVWCVLVVSFSYWFEFFFCFCFVLLLLLVVCSNKDNIYIKSIINMPYWTSSRVGPIVGNSGGGGDIHNSSKKKKKKDEAITTHSNMASSRRGITMEVSFFGCPSLKNLFCRARNLYGICRSVELYM